MFSIRHELALQGRELSEHDREITRLGDRLKEERERRIEATREMQEFKTAVERNALYELGKVTLLLLNFFPVFYLKIKAGNGSGPGQGEALKSLAAIFRAGDAQEGAR